MSIIGSIISKLEALNVFHDEARLDDQFVVASTRMRARARHHMRDQECLMQVLVALGPFVRIWRIDTMNGRPSGGMVVLTTDNRRLWLGQSLHEFTIYEEAFQTGQLVTRIPLR